jgi:hypothetical protein
VAKRRVGEKIPAKVIKKLYLSKSFTSLLELPQYLEEAGWAAEGRKIACTQVSKINHY